MVFCLFLGQKYKEIDNYAINVHNMRQSVLYEFGGFFTRFWTTVSKTETVVVLSILETTTDKQWTAKNILAVQHVI